MVCQPPTYRNPLFGNLAFLSFFALFALLSRSPICAFFPLLHLLVIFHLRQGCIRVVRD